MKLPSVPSVLSLLSVLCLTSCWPPPVAIAVQGNYGTYGYSAKRGFEISINATK